jgi:hypothetical protein
MAEAMRLLVAAALLLLPTAAHAGSGFFSPPLRLDYGAAASLGAPSPSAQLAVGLHWASVDPRRDGRLDLGGGLILRSAMLGAEEPTHEAGVDVTPVGAASLAGGYLEGAWRVAGGGSWRGWVGVRGERGWARLGKVEGAYTGVALRVSAEVFAPLVGGGNNGIICGAFALGLYGEIALRRIDDVGDDVGISLGLSGRLPLILVGS